MNSKLTSWSYVISHWLGLPIYLRLCNHFKKKLNCLGNLSCSISQSPAFSWGRSELTDRNVELYPQFFLELITTQLRFYMVSPQLSLLIILTMQSYKFYLFRKTWLINSLFVQIKGCNGCYSVSPLSVVRRNHSHWYNNNIFKKKQFSTRWITA